MLPNNALVNLLKTAESQYLERKAHCPKDAELRATLCAFANSTPPSQYSVLLIGVEDAGNVSGIDPTTIDGTQKKIIKIARDDCYPPIHAVPQVIEIEGKVVLAVVVEHSKNTPHFTGHAYVRQGSTSPRASEAAFESLILKRIDKVARLLRTKENGLVIRVSWKLGPISTDVDRRPNMVAYRVDDCDAFVLKLFNTASHTTVAVPLDRVTINYSTEHQQDLLLIDEFYPAKAQ